MSVSSRRTRVVSTTGVWVTLWELRLTQSAACARFVEGVLRRGRTCRGHRTNFAAKPETVCGIELAGPRVYFYEDLLRTIARIAGLRPVLSLPYWMHWLGVVEMLPRPPLTRNQVELMQIVRALGISPRSLEDQLEVIIRQSKLGGHSL